MEDEEQEVCQHLSWDSEFFGQRIVRISSESVGTSELEHILEWCRKEKVNCVTFLVDCGDDRNLQAAIRNGFDLIDLRVTLTALLGAGPAKNVEKDSGVRPYRLGDLPDLEKIARSSHRDSRFFHDPRIPSSRAEDLFAEWIRKSCSGWADSVLVAEHGERPCGYLSCHIGSKSDKGFIGLFAIDQVARGKGIGSRLLSASLQWFRAKGIQRVDIVTQGRNTAAQTFYQKNGFRTASIGLWFHRWL